MFLTGSEKYFGTNTSTKIIISRKSKQKANMFSTCLKKYPNFYLNFLLKFRDLGRRKLKVHHFGRHYILVQDVF